MGLITAVTNAIIPSSRLPSGLNLAVFGASSKEVKLGPHLNTYLDRKLASLVSLLYHGQIMARLAHVRLFAL